MAGVERRGQAPTVARVSLLAALAMTAFAAIPVLATAGNFLRSLPLAVAVLIGVLRPHRKVHDSRARDRATSPAEKTHPD